LPPEILILHLVLDLELDRDFILDLALLVLDLVVVLDE